jgi:diacylglycerol kinase family enzyme
MYYYIFDVKKCKKRSQVEDIKSYLSSLGISGEFTYPTSAQSVSELVKLGLSKQYTTIVAIGSDGIANSVASQLLGRGEAMGFIPLEITPELAALVGTSNWKEACDILRFRKISEIKVGRTGTGYCFLTSAQLLLNNPTEITLEFKDFIIQSRMRDLKIANFDLGIKKLDNEFLDINFHSSKPENAAIFSKISSIFKGDKEPNNEKNFSLVRARSLRVFAKSQIPIVSGNEIIAKTPQLIESSDENLRLITAKKASAFWEK